jgi:hypothetical protein
MRALDTSPGRPAGERPSFAVSLTGARGQLQLTPAGYPRLHFPDCAVIGSGAEGDRLLAVELERTAKGRARLRRILAGYVAARHIGSVRYYVRGDRVRNLVEDVVTAHRAAGLIEVRDWAPLARDHAGFERGLERDSAASRDLRPVSSGSRETPVCPPQQAPRAPPGDSSVSRKAALRSRRSELPLVVEAVA